MSVNSHRWWSNTTCQSKETAPKKETLMPNKWKSKSQKQLTLLVWIKSLLAHQTTPLVSKTAKHSPLACNKPKVNVSTPRYNYQNSIPHKWYPTRYKFAFNLALFHLNLITLKLINPNGNTVWKNKSMKPQTSCPTLTSNSKPVWQTMLRSARPLTQPAIRNITIFNREF